VRRCRAGDVSPAGFPEIKSVLGGDLSTSSRRAAPSSQSLISPREGAYGMICTTTGTVDGSSLVPSTGGLGDAIPTLWKVNMIVGQRLAASNTWSNATHPRLTAVRVSRVVEPGTARHQHAGPARGRARRTAHGARHGHPARSRVPGRWSPASTQPGPCALQPHGLFQEMTEQDTGLFPYLRIRLREALEIDDRGSSASHGRKSRTRTPRVLRTDRRTGSYDDAVTNKDAPSRKGPTPSTEANLLHPRRYLDYGRIFDQCVSELSGSQRDDVV